MGGGGGGKKKKSAPPPQAEPIDYSKLMAESSKAAQESYRDQLKAQIESYPQMEALQLGTIQTVADKLGQSEYTQRARQQLLGVQDTPEKLNQYAATNIGYANRTSDLSDTVASLVQPNTSLAVRTAQLGQKASNLADQSTELLDKSISDLEGTEIERELQAQAARELALGRSLTPEQERMARQSARAGMAARGLGVGSGALAAEILNRDMFASQREADRRNFAGATNQMLVGNRQARLGTSANMFGLTGNLYNQSGGLFGQTSNILGQSANIAGQSGNLLGAAGNLVSQAGNLQSNRANLAMGLAQAETTIDPYARALAPGAGMGSSTLGQSGQMISNTWQGATQMAGNVASFNANMLDSRYNSYMNNQAALQGAQMQAGAASQAGTMGMIGSIGGAAIGAVGLAVF